MADSWFLKVDGIPGESTDAAHKDEIDVESWSWGVANATSPATGTGGGAGKAEFADFHFVSWLSRASPPLFLACATGTKIKEANLAGRRSAAMGKSRLPEVPAE